MKAAVFHGVGNIQLDEINKPVIIDSYDAIVKITISAICGTDLHFIRGTVNPMKKGTVLGHEAVGIVESIGKKIKNLDEGDRVIIPSTIGCGYCRLCRRGIYSQCEVANPLGAKGGTAFFGGPISSGSFHGCQSEYVRVPYANNNLVKLPKEVSDDKAILLSDIFPTGYFSAELANVKPGKVVVVIGCGAVGLFSILSCKLLGASRIFAIDTISSRLAMARNLGAECINFNEDDPTDFISEATKGSLADVVIDAVGVDAVRPSQGPAASEANAKKDEYERELEKIVPDFSPQGDNWIPGNAPSQVLSVMPGLAGKCGTLSIVGVYPEYGLSFPIGKAINKNLKIVMGNCNHRAYIPKLLQIVQAGIVDPTEILTQTAPLVDVIEAYKQFDKRESGWIKVALVP